MTLRVDDGVNVDRMVAENRSLSEKGLSELHLKAAAWDKLRARLRELRSREHALQNVPRPQFWMLLAWMDELEGADDARQ